MYARTDQVIAGLERAVDPNHDGDAHDAARIALIGVAVPYAAFTDSPEARAIQGALQLDTLVVAPAGNDGPAGPAFGSISSPGGSPAALTVAAADLRARREEVRVVVRVGLDLVLDRPLPLAGAVVAERRARARARRAARGRRQPPRAFFDGHGRSLVAGRAALVDGGSRSAARDRVRRPRRRDRGGRLRHAAPGRRARRRRGGEHPGRQRAAARRAGRARRDPGARHPAVSIGLPRVVHNASEGGIAPFSSRGLAFDGRVKPDLAAPGVALTTSEPGANDDGTPSYGTVNGSSPAAAVVAGAAAVLAQVRPGLRALDLEAC